MGRTRTLLALGGILFLLMVARGFHGLELPANWRRNAHPTQAKVVLVGDSRVWRDLDPRALARAAGIAPDDVANLGIHCFALVYSAQLLEAVRAGPEVAVLIALTPTGFSRRFAECSADRPGDLSLTLSDVLRGDRWRAWRGSLSRELRAKASLPVFDPIELDVPSMVTRLAGNSSARHVLDQAHESDYFFGSPRGPGALATIEESDVQAFERQLRTWKAEGRTIVLVRLPVAVRMRAADDATGLPERFRAWAEVLGFPYRDFSSAEFALEDQTHLAVDEVERFSAEVGTWLRDAVGSQSRPKPR